MKTRSIRHRTFILAALAAVTTTVWAGCRKDCTGDLEAALQACAVNYANNPQDLQECRETAQREYQACLEDCRG